MRPGLRPASSPRTRLAILRHPGTTDFVADFFAAVLPIPLRIWQTLVHGEPGGTMDAPEHEDLRQLLNELAAKGYRPAQLEAVRSYWEAACQAGAHPDLAAAVHALEPGVHGRRP